MQGSAIMDAYLKKNIDVGLPNKADDLCYPLSVLLRKISAKPLTGRVQQSSAGGFL